MRILVLLLIASGFALTLYLLFFTNLLESLLLKLKRSKREQLLANIASEVVDSSKKYETELRTAQADAEKALEERLFDPVFVYEKLQPLTAKKAAKKAVRKRAPRKKVAEQVAPQQ